MRRVQCRQCGVKAEQVPWAMGKHTLTKAYMLYLAHWARKLSWKETALSFGTTWDQVCHAVEYVVQWGLEHRELGTLRAIGVDEIHIGQSHKFLTLVYQIEADCVRLLSTLRHATHDAQLMPRGQRNSLHLHCKGLPPSDPRRPPCAPDRTLAHSAGEAARKLSFANACNWPSRVAERSTDQCRRCDA